jgi:hypothetical protein
MARLGTQNVLTNPADRLSHEQIDRLWNSAHNLEVELRYERLRPARLPLDQGLGVDAGSDIAEPPEFAAPRVHRSTDLTQRTADGCFTECA